MAKKTKLPPVVRLTAQQIDLGSKYLAASNLGYGHPVRSIAELEQQYRRCDLDHACDGADISDEVIEWRDQLRIELGQRRRLVIRRLQWIQ